MIPVFIILFLLSVLWLRVLYQWNVSLRYQHRLYALRDQLRSAAIEGEIRPDGKVFDFLDFCISMTIDKVHKFSFWTWVSYRLVMAFKRPKVSKECILLEKELNNNETAHRIYLQMWDLSNMAMLDRHRYSMIAVLCTLLPFMGLAKMYQKYRNQTVKEIMEARDHDYLHYC